ncbi:MAG: methyltransferase [Kouleothrix sp.]|nr:methyltransferase [Kouleothrix sp.]
MSYDQIHSFSAQLGGQTVRFVSKPGLAHWDDVSPASRLLADTVRPAADARVLLLGCGHGALGAALARQARAGATVLMDSSVVAAAMARRTLDANAAANARVCEEASLPGELEGWFDVAAIELPSDRKLARRWLLEAYRALRPGGDLFVAGASDQGARSAIADAAALCGGAGLLAYKQGSRVAQARKSTDAAPGVDWASEPGVAPGTWYEFEARARGLALRIHSLAGVFAYDRVDEGTRLLLEALELPPGARVLDIGCGYGMIGLLAARLGASQVDLVDANLLAVASAAENIKINGVAGARACAGDGVPAGAAERYDVVATNPPFHLGKAVDYEVARAFIEGARQALKPGGRFYLVANQFIRYDQLLRVSFARVTCVAETRSYRVWRSDNLQVV